MCSAGTGSAGPVEVVATYVGGNRKNILNALSKVAVVGAKDRATNEVVTKVVPATDRDTLQVFAKDYAGRQARVYPDGTSAYVAVRACVREARGWRVGAQTGEHQRSGIS